MLQEINIGVAVSLPEGLIVPTIRRADEKPLVQIARETHDLSSKAREGRASYEEVTGGTFTITNLGPYGIDAFTPIINAPQVGILGVGRVIEKPVVYRGDHQAVDDVPQPDVRPSRDRWCTGNRISPHSDGPPGRPLVDGRLCLAASQPQIFWTLSSTYPCSLVIAWRSRRP